MLGLKIRIYCYCLYSFYRSTLLENPFTRARSRILLLVNGFVDDALRNTVPSVNASARQYYVSTLPDVTQKLKHN